MTVPAMTTVRFSVRVFKLVEVTLAVEYGKRPIHEKA